MPTKRTITQREEDLELIARLTRRGYHLKQIAAEIAKVRDYTISYVQVSNDLKKIRKQWAASAIADIAAIKRQELEGLADQERECWAAWEKSKLAAEKQKQRVRTGGGGPGAGQLAERSTEKQEQCGDPAFQKLILDIRDKRAKLIGLNEAEKMEVSGPAGGPIEVEHHDDEHIKQWAKEYFDERQRDAEAAKVRGDQGQGEPA